MNEKYCIEYDRDLNLQNVEMKLSLLKDFFVVQENGVFAGKNMATDKPHPYKAEDLSSILCFIF